MFAKLWPLTTQKKSEYLLTLMTSYSNQTVKYWRNSTKNISSLISLLPLLKFGCGKLSLRFPSSSFWTRQKYDTGHRSDLKANFVDKGSLRKQKSSVYLLMEPKKIERKRGSFADALTDFPTGREINVRAHSKNWCDEADLPKSCFEKQRQLCRPTFVSPEIEKFSVNPAAWLVHLN